MTTPARIADAVTAVLLHDGEIFVVRRARDLAAFPGYTAFPGGKVDASDSDARLEGGSFAEHPPRLIRALARELQEELGFNFLQAYRQRQVKSIQGLGQATTPAFAPLRFRTWFFLIRLTQRPSFKLDTREAEAGEWASAKQLVNSYQQGQRLMVPPTLEVLKKLAATPNARSVQSLEFEFDADREIPCVESLYGLKIFLVRSNTLPPAAHTNCFLFGDAGAPQVLVDPSPCNDAEYQRLLDSVRPLRPDLIFLTHHHHDHRERADRLARELGIPMMMSADTRTRIAKRQSADFFKGIELQLAEDGTEISRWLGKPVTALAVPGHDQGQLALLPECRSWCIVGDLIQGIGTVVIAPPEGDMAAYFESLRKVIKLDPAVVIPSHGPALGSSYRIQTALQHREQREADVRQAWIEGCTETEMLQRLYADIDPRLLPLARININGHLKKLKDEGRLPA